MSPFRWDLVVGGRGMAVAFSTVFILSTPFRRAHLTRTSLWGSSSANANHISVTWIVRRIENSNKLQSLYEIILEQNHHRQQLGTHLQALVINTKIRSRRKFLFMINHNYLFRLTREANTPLETMNCP